MPGLAVYLGAMCWLVAAPRRHELWQGVFVGLAIGIRPHALLPLLPLLFPGRAGRRLLGVAVGAAVWFGGMMLHQGADAVLVATAQQSMSRFAVPGFALFSPGMDAAGAVHRVQSYLGVWLGAAWPFADDWRGPAVLALLFGGAVRSWRRLPRSRLPLLGAALYALFLYCFMSTHPRYLLLALPVATLCLCWQSAAAALVLAALLLPHARERSAQLLAERSPPDRALTYMDAVDPDRALPVLESGLQWHCRVLAPERLRLGLNAAPMPDTRAFFTDNRVLADQARKDGWTLVETRTFTRDLLVHDKDWRVELFWLARP
jgi:hypothetical protein